jgi:predicted P-loop ATPase
MSDGIDVLHEKRKSKAKSNKKADTRHTLTPQELASFIRSELGIELRYNTILQRVEYKFALETTWHQWADTQDTWLLKVRGAATHKDLANLQILQKAVEFEARCSPTNPIRNYLQSCPMDWSEWAKANGHVVDGTAMSPGFLLAQYIDSDMEKTVLASIFDAWLVGCAMHGYSPERNDWSGATICPILVGPQGCNKSNFTKWLGTAAGIEYYDESVIDADSKDARIALSKVWIWAADEFSGTIRKRGSEAVKNFLTRKTINERPSYGRVAIWMPRLASFIGSCNQDMPLQDTTGNRRFAVVYLKGVRLNELKSVLPVDRLWGAAMWLWQKLNVTPALDEYAQETVNHVNASALDVHPWTEILLKRLEFGNGHECTAQDILQDILGIYPADQTQSQKRILHDIFRSPAFAECEVSSVFVWRNGKSLRVWRGCKIKTF